MGQTERNVELGISCQPEEEEASPPDCGEVFTARLVILVVVRDRELVANFALTSLESPDRVRSRPRRRSTMGSSKRGIVEPSLRLSGNSIISARLN